MAKKMSEIPLGLRPRERIERDGAQVLTDIELMAVLLGSGNAKDDVFSLATKLIKSLDGKGLNLTLGDLTSVPGIGKAKATIVLAALEFARRRIKPDGIKIETSSGIVPLIQHFAFQRQEYVICVTINGANEVINIHTLAVGSLDRAPLEPRDVFSCALQDRASAIILAHNHPEGELTPSFADREVTTRLKQTGELVGIPLLDHIIFNRKDYFSFLDQGI